MKKIRNIAIVLVCITVFMISPLGISLALIPLSINSASQGTNPRVICILGGGYNPETVLGISTEERLRHASSLVSSDTAHIHMIDYMGIQKDFYKQEVYRLFRDEVAEKISFHLKSRNTLDNCRVISTLVSRDEPCLVVTSPYHVLRTRMILYMMGLTATSVVCPDDSEVYHHSSIAQWQRNFVLVYREYAAIIRDFAVLFQQKS